MFKNDSKKSSFPQLVLTLVLLFLVQFQAKATVWNDYLKLNFPTEVDSSVGFEWSNCEVKDEAYHLTMPDPLAELNGRPLLREDCQPDTLYSWQRYSGLERLKDQIGDSDSSWPDQVTHTDGSEILIYTHTDPIATFAYGPYPIRFKIRKDVRFVIYKEVTSASTISRDQFCHGGVLTEDQAKDYVILRYVEKALNGQYQSNEFTFAEYILCSPKVLESWSYGYPRHYDEIVKATQWYNESENIFGKGNGHKFYETYMKYRTVDLLMFSNPTHGFDGFPSNWNVLFARLKLWKSLVPGNEPTENSIMAFNFDDLSPKTVEYHFKTDHKIYFNEK